jgi:hypothetical protein
MNRRRVPTTPGGSRGAALVTVLVFVLAGMALAAATTRTGMLEIAMADRGANRLQAIEAAEKGRAHALQSGEWSAGPPWTDAGTLADGAQWQVEMRLALAWIDAESSEVEWHFEIHSEGRAGTARFAMVQGFSVAGALPGEPRLTWWRQAEPPP